MRSIHSLAQAALDSGAFTVRNLLKATLPDPDGVLALWDDNGTIEVASQTYEGKPGRFTMQPSQSVQDLSIQNLDVTLSALDDDVAVLVDSSPWHQRPVETHRAIITVADPTTIHVLPEFSGFADQMRWVEEVNGTSSLVFRCESASREMSRSGTRTRGNSDQRQRDSVDGIFEFASSAVATAGSILWGRSPQNVKQPSSGLAGFLGKIF